MNLNPKGIRKCWLRNQSVALELSSADQIVAPTLWQKKQLPRSLQNRCHVIFDGIDLNRFKPLEPSEHRRENVFTYGTRGMDPMRCFPQFIEEIPEVLKNFPKSLIEIAGQDKAFYGVKHYKNHATWGTWAKEFIQKYNLTDRVKWLGNLPPGKYEKWLRTSGCHVYLTHPFVCSWSLVEAFCSGSPIIASDIEAVREVCSDNSLIYYIDHRKQGFLTEALLKLNSDKERYRAKNCLYARDSSKFGIKTALLGWERVAGLKVATND